MASISAINRYSASLEKFRASVAKDRTAPKDIVSKIASTGDYKELRGIDVVVNSIRNLLLTPKRSYVFDPEYGIGIHKYIFEPFDASTKDEIRAEIMDACRRYEGRAYITVKITQMVDMKTFVVNMTVKYEGEERTLSVKYDENLLRTINESSQGNVIAGV